MPEKAQINLQVDESQKERWEEYQESSDTFTTLSDLIRTSVETHIKDEDDDQEQSSPALASDVQDLKAKLKDMKQDISWIRKQHLDDEVVSDVAQEVFDELEPLPQTTGPVEIPENVEMDRSEYKQQLAAQAVIEPDSEDDESNPQTAKDIANRLGTSPRKVEDAIDHLQDQFLPVTEIEYRDEVHYFKEG